MLGRMLHVMAILAAFNISQAGAATVLELDPASGALSGAPGATIGWGFSLSNDTGFLVVTGATFESGTTLGTFTDFISSPGNFFVVGPAPEAETVAQAFSVANQTGLGGFHVDPAAPTAATISCQLVLTYDLFSRSPNDPNFDPVTDTQSVANILSQPASITIVPLPGSVWMMLWGLAGLSRVSGKRPNAKSLRIGFNGATAH